MTTAQHPRVGVAVFVLDDKNNFILGARKGSHGAGTLALPGGHLETSESFATCAAREVLEETGLVITDIEFLTATNDVFSASDVPQGRATHYVTIFVTARRQDASAQPKVLEPDKCEGWDWTGFGELLRAAEREKEDGNAGERWFLPMMNLVRQRGDVVKGLVKS